MAVSSLLEPFEQPLSLVTALEHASRLVKAQAWHGKARVNATMFSLGMVKETDISSTMSCSLLLTKLYIHTCCLRYSCRFLLMHPCRIRLASASRIHPASFITRLKSKGTSEALA